MRMNDHGLRQLPFVIDRHSPRGLSDQMTDGLRNAILTGYYREGESLPKILEWAKLLNVSIRVPEAAIARLVKEGLVAAHPGLGCVVRPRKALAWRGHVLFVMPDSETVYSANVMASRMRTRFSSAGYLVTQHAVWHDPDGRYDLSQLELTLKQPVELVILFAKRQQIEHFLSVAAVPFVVIGQKTCRLPHCVGHVRLHLEAALPDFVQHCARAKVRSVLQVEKPPEIDAVPLLRKAKIAAERWRIPELPGRRPAAVQQSALEAFKRRLAEGVDWLPDVLYFTDDFLAAGALTALLHEGVRIPEDVRVVTIANKGLGPVFWDTLARIELDSHAGGDDAAEHVLAWLGGDRRHPIDCTISTTYRPGATFTT